MTARMELFTEWSMTQRAIEDWDAARARWSDKPPLKFYLVGGPLWLWFGNLCRRRMVKRRQAILDQMPADMRSRLERMP